MTEQETFITRLRRHRERNRIPLEAIARDTRVKLDLLEALEKNDLSAWPRGLYARAYIRAYAAAIGLDGGDAVDEFCRLFPQGDRRTDSVIREIAAIVASPSEYRDEYQREMNRRRSPQADMPAPARGTVTGTLMAWVSGIVKWPARESRSPKGLRHNA